MSTTEPTPVRVSRTAIILSNVVSLVIITSILIVLWLAWPTLAAIYQARTVSPVSAPLVQPTAIVRVQPAQPQVVQPAPVIVQSVPQGQAPQPVTIPAPAPAAEQPAAPAPIVIVHQVSSDGAHQVITGSGACKVTRVAARCGK